MPRTPAPPVLILALLAGAAPAQLALHTFAGDQSGAACGSSMAMDADLDGDLLADIVVGEPGYDATILGEPKADVGRVRAWSGADGSLLWSRVGFDPGEEYGFDVAMLGALTGDGRSEVIVGRPGARITVGSTSLATGGIAILSGADGSVVHAFKSFDLSAPRFGHAVAGLGDRDFDGTRDYAVGSPYDDPAGNTDAGTVSLYSGDTHAVFHTFTGLQSGAAFGWSIDALDPDGQKGPILIGEPFYSTSAASPNEGGRVSAWEYTFILGNPVGVLTAEWTDGGFSHLGTSVALLGDIDGGIDELAMGAPGAGGAGEVTIASTNGSILHIESGEQLGERFGFAVDGDPLGNVLAGAPEYDSGSKLDAGEARVFDALTGTPIARYTGSRPGARAGHAVCAGRDVDGDGSPDLCVGYPGAEPSGLTGAGQAVTYGAPCPADTYTYGSALAGTLGVPALTLDADPVLGELVTITLGNSAGVATPAVLFLGLVEAALPFKGGTLMLHPAASLPLTLPPGDVPLPTLLPDDPALCGGELFLQLAVADAGAPLGVALSYGLFMLFGNV